MKLSAYSVAAVLVVGSSVSAQVNTGQDSATTTNSGTSARPSANTTPNVNTDPGSTSRPTYTPEQLFGTSTPRSPLDNRTSTPDNPTSSGTSVQGQAPG